mgnify:CR=1 FL=1
MKPTLRGEDYRSPAIYDTDLESVFHRRWCYVGRSERLAHVGDRLVIDENDKPTLTKIKDAVTLEDINKGGWNELHVIVKGNNFKFYINGKLSSEFTENLKKERRLHSGMIQLQLHDPGMIVKFKDLQIKVLK